MVEGNNTTEFEKSENKHDKYQLPSNFKYDVRTT